MVKVIAVAGYGPGISNAMAVKFGQAGFKVALLARTVSKLKTSAQELSCQGIEAKAFPVDLSDCLAVKNTLAAVAQELGPIHVLHWNPYIGNHGDIMNLSQDDLDAEMRVAVHGLLAAVQTVVPSMETLPDSAILVTTAPMQRCGEPWDAMGVKYNGIGLSVAAAARHKLVMLMSVALKPKGVFVGEVEVIGRVIGSSTDDGSGAATIKAETVAEKFWQLYTDRLSVCVSCGYDPPPPGSEGSAGK